MGRFPKGWHPETKSKYLSIKYLMIYAINWHPNLSVQKTHFGGPFGGFSKGWDPKLCQNIFLLIIC